MPDIKFAKNAIAELQDFVRTNGHEALKDYCGVCAKTDGENIIFDYDLTADWDKPFPYVCRGLVLCASTYELRAAPLFKFFNLQEPQADSIKWGSAKVFEKLDGTMVCRFYDRSRGDFVYTTRYQLPHEVESNIVHESGITWRQLIDKCVGPLTEAIEQEEHETIVFEVMSPLNRVVVHHKAFKASMLMRRDNTTLQETDLSDHPLAPKTYAFSSPEEVSAFAHKLKGVEQEGFVVVDENLQRVKIKGEDYVRLHLLRSSQTSSIKNLIKAIRHGEEGELEAYFPEYTGAIEAVKKIRNDQIARHEQALHELNDIQDQKEFAIKLLDMKLSAPDTVFSVRAGKHASIEEAIRAYDDYRYVRWLKPLVDQEQVTLVSIEG